QAQGWTLLDDCCSISGKQVRLVFGADELHDSSPL
ncbi:MAG: hypothetical protein JWP31_2040, partial [Aeromicrobium sp.]|nr:hypothetical protein [Aeromicrobium sp.]